MEERPRFSGWFLCAPEFISIALINSYTLKQGDHFHAYEPDPHHRRCRSCCFL